MIDEALDAALALLGAGEPRLVTLSAELLGGRADLGPAPLLRELLDHSEPSVVRAAARALGRLRDPLAIPRLVEVIELRPRCSLDAIAALGAIGHAAATPPLVRWIDEPTLTTAIAQALGRIGDRAALPTLLDRLIGAACTGARIAALIAIAEILRADHVASHELTPLRCALDQSRGLPGFVSDVVDADDREVARAAVRLVLAGELTRWLPRVLLRAVERDDLAWTETECARWADRIGPLLDALLVVRDPLLARAALRCAAVVATSPRNLR
jgi:HEAT repeat protein